MKEPRPHQLEALKALENINEGIIHLPTGTGKTLIQALAFVNNIDNAWKWLKENNKPDEIPVFVTLCPRILLTNQLYSDISEILIQNKKDVQNLIVHSGKTNQNLEFGTLPFRQIKSTTSSTEIKIQYERAKAEKVPLIIYGTYDSSERIMKSGIPVYMLCCDEAHNLVSLEFNWIAEENLQKLKYFSAYRKYYFTATLKETASDKGLGMNNSELFGEIIYEKTPLEMINSGDIIRPRIHLVDVSKNIGLSELDKDVNAIIDSFREHKLHCNRGTKLLVITKGSEHLNDITTHLTMKKFMKLSGSKLQIFDISSAKGARINGELVKRELFLEKLRNLGDNDDAIIFHINILSEGIDVPGITGIMPMSNLSTSRFLQTYGRCSRLHTEDREDLRSNIKKPIDLSEFIKPYGWIIIPVYGVAGEDLRESLTEIVYALRKTGFRASEDVVIREIKGVTLPQPLGGINELDTRARGYRELFISVTHDIEEHEIADKIAIEDFRENELIKTMPTNILIKQLF